MDGNKYIHILDADGKRITSIVDNMLKPIGEEDLIKQAKEQYPNANQYIYGNDDMLNQFLSGKIYKEGKFVDPPPYVPSDIELKEQEISELNEEFKTAEEEYLEAMRKALLLSDTSLQSEIQTDYKDLLASYTDEVARLNAELVELKGE